MAGFPKAIETAYKGYRFRSRLEARWAVTFDQLGIVYEYEPQGFELDGAGRYLPDFWLPKQQTWVEIKPENVPADDRAMEKLKALAVESGHPAFMLCGDPASKASHRLARPERLSWVEQNLDLTCCLSCGALDLSGWQHPSGLVCQCQTRHTRYSPDLIHRLNAARSRGRTARFEFGEHGAKAGQDEVVPSTGQVYLAGKIHDAEEQDWRIKILGSPATQMPIGGRIPWERLTFGGPDLMNDHGSINHGIAAECLGLVAHSDAVFCWINSDAIHGTLAEIGYARAHNKPTFVGFEINPCTPNEDGLCIDHLDQTVWFARELASEWVAVPRVEDAWNLFRAWWAQRSNA